MLNLNRLQTLGIIFTLIVLLVGCSSPTITAPPSPESPTVQKPVKQVAKVSITTDISKSPHLILGNPSNATEDVKNSDNYLIVRPQYSSSYNRNKAIVNWTSWKLNSDWLGKLPRPPFNPDLSLPDGWYRVTPNDYNNSGFDRGHMVPAADRNKTSQDSKSVFVMSNIIPQAPDNNQGPWEKLESYSRELVREGKELYIIAGSSGVGGVGKIGEATTINDGKITVPANTWKIVVVLDKPGAGLNGITSNTRVIAVNMPNKQGIKDESWTKFKTSVDEIEKTTGYDFLSNVSPNIQEVIESNVDNVNSPLTQINN